MWPPKRRKNALRCGSGAVSARACLGGTFGLALSVKRSDLAEPCKRAASLWLRIISGGRYWLTIQNTE